MLLTGASKVREEWMVVLRGKTLTPTDRVVVILVRVDPVVATRDRVAREALW